MFRSDVPRRRHTRRQVLQLGAAAAAAGSALRPLSAQAASCSGAFEMRLDEDGARAAGGWRRTRVYRAPRRFDLIGLRWPRGARVEAQIRARKRNGRWTPWVPLHPAGDHAPDRGRAASGSEPVFTGAADLFQLRLRGGTRGLRARFVRALPEARRAARRRSVRARSSRARQVAPGGPSIIPRADWGADSCPPRTSPSYGQINLAFVHHTVTASEYGPEDSAGIVLGICRYHRNHNGWNDVGYNFLVDKYGQIFEGRAGGIDQAVIGAQAQGYNSLSTGVSVLGDYTAVPLPDPALDAVASLLAWKLGIHGVPVEGEVTVTSGGGDSNRYRYGTAVTFQRISGHRDGNETECPGHVLYGQLEDLRARTAARSTAPVSRVTLQVDTTRVRYPAALRVSGSLRFADGASPSGATIAIEHSTDGLSYSRVGDAVTDFEGRWATSVELTASGRLRARYAGDTAHPPLVSAPVSFKVAPRMTLSRRPVRARYGRWVRYEGTFEPQPASSQLVVKVERQNRRKRWRRVQRERISVIDGSFSGRVRVDRPGLYRLVVKGPGGTVRRSFRALAGGGRASRRRVRGTGGSRAR